MNTNDELKAGKWIVPLSVIGILTALFIGLVIIISAFSGLKDILTVQNSLSQKIFPYTIYVLVTISIILIIIVVEKPNS